MKVQDVLHKGVWTVRLYEGGRVELWSNYQKRPNFAHLCVRDGLGGRVVEWHTYLPDCAVALVWRMYRTHLEAK